MNPLGEDEVRHPAGPGRDGVPVVLAERSLERSDVHPQRDGREDQRVAAGHPLEVALHVAATDAREGDRRGEQHTEHQQREPYVGDSPGRRELRHVEAAQLAYDRAAM